jgi:hypothetical protein
LNAFGNKSASTLKANKGEWGTWDYKIFLQIKMLHRLIQVPAISNVFEFDLKWKK